ncbi:MAG: phage tail tape measure C-terminal domain-containing protein [Pseudomonadota bacterium]
MSETEPIRGEDTSGDLTTIAAGQLESLNALVEATFTEMSRSVEEELARLSSGSRVVMRDMVDAILEDLTRLAAQELLSNPLERALGIAGEKGTEAGGDAIGEALRRSLRNG